MSADQGGDLGGKLLERIEALPQTPGVYLMKSAKDRVLYVGKAQNLRARVRSYFGGGDGRVQVPNLVRRIADVSVLVTPSVKDALLLENELIKQHRPPFNVRLRDDKQYLRLRLDPREEWPRLVQVRRFERDGALYFGPYASSGALHQSISQLRRIFPLRNCSDPVFKDYARRGRPCIEHEIGRCPAPCVGLVTAEAYRELLASTELFLRGRSEELVETLRARMEAAAAEQRFEDAARLRDRIAAVEQTVLRQQIVTERRLERDVFALARQGGEVQVQALHVREGRLIGASEHAFSQIDLDSAEVIGSFLGQLYGDPERSIPVEVLVSHEPADDGALEALLSERSGRKVTVRVPQRGPAQELIALALRNAEGALERRLAARESVDAAALELQERLGLARPPRRIECYDVSNLAGTLAVGSRVVFEGGQPVKGDYRRYRVREAAAGDDLACLREVLARRLARHASEPLPDLLMVDGGRGQLAVASALLADLGLELDHVGLAKERDLESPSPRVRRSGGLKAERVFLPGRLNPVLLPPSSRGLLLLQRVRDEAHRFAIAFQRELRRRTGLTSVLQEIPGIGPGKRKSLLRTLGSLRRVRAAPVEEIAAVPGLSRRDAEAIRRFFDAFAAEPAEDAPPEAPPAPGAEG